ncbi:sucrose-6-phosphate hydrolase [Bacillus lacus]|uniref:Sucrose-6-phosphate hydrolase n=1 Tax=Metabacillus lacus TaxID=1983721 RepID=A0A7X2IWY6_9BACI|nr:sucrose-6-phosphate hydrolase [Metabacillus lacus]MRX71204.1 sucrose-6-phosphate hydrolase [Metabacillus lacus]
MSKDQQLRMQAKQEEEKNKSIVEQDPYRLQYHIMPPVGLLNDPNGFIEWGGKYHLFYQWMPFKTDHGAKFWGHYSSVDLVNWTHEEIALTPSEEYEKNGCYSGSAIEHEGNLFAFYTGNVKDDQGNRETYQCLAVSEDGIHFEKRGPVVKLPDGYTPHFRDPKVWKDGDKYLMVVGAQTEDLKGAVALLESDNLLEWNHKGILAGGGSGKLSDFGYMFECPDLFSLDGSDVLVFSPQGLEPQGIHYQNVYQAGYVTGTFHSESGTYDHGDFEELDRGFDFYAPQTTLDSKGRRLMFAWMSVPDQDEQEHPTIKHKWLHNMTIPRELKMIDSKVYQLPVEELKLLRTGDASVQQVKLTEKDVKISGVSGKSVELLLENVETEGWFDICFGGAARLVYSPEQKLLTLERESYVSGITENRQCKVDNLSSLHVYLDTSSVEIFVNGGEHTFTARFYPHPDNDTIYFGAETSAEFRLLKWNLA